MAPKVKLGTFGGALAILFNKGIRFGTVIDVGCAEAYFFARHRYLGMLPDAVPLNIDANPVYEPVLRQIRDVHGGHYLIGAVGDREGELTLWEGADPYWTSPHGPGSDYWRRMAHEPTGSRTVPVTTLDTLARDLALKPPFLLKLDIQGGEAAALAGGAAVLAETDVVIVETEMVDFQRVNAALVERGFDLFDLTEINRLNSDRSLAWFYPIYLNRRLDHLRESRLWSEARTPEVAAAQRERHDNVRRAITQMLGGRPAG
ncbi:MAG: FkbM family methyltransferase [Alphaproteobacteria bacterium]